MNEMHPCYKNLNSFIELNNSAKKKNVNTQNNSRYLIKTMLLVILSSYFGSRSDLCLLLILHTYCYIRCLKPFQKKKRCLKH